MSKFWTILGFTYTSHLKSKSFIITTLITLVLIFGLANFQNILDWFDDGEGANHTETIAVIDDTDQTYSKLETSLTNMDENIEVTEFAGTEEEAKEAVKDDEFLGYAQLTLNDQGLPAAHFYAMSIAETNHVVDVLQQSLSQVKTEMITQQAGIDQATVQQIFAPVSIETESLQAEARSTEELNQARGLVYFMIFLIYFAVLMYGNMIASEVAVEKSSRVMEIIVSSVSPITQMFAKIAGIALLGLTQFGLIILIGYASLKTNQSELVGGIFEYLGLGETPVSTIVYAVVFFLLGYLLYAMLAAMLGSLVSRTEEVNQMITPMTLLIIAAFMIAMYGLNDPTASFVTITSYIPFFTPIIMFVRVGMLNTPFWEIALSMGILILTIFILANIAAKVYKGGVLMYGASTSIKDIRKALQLSKKE
ncbi:ABC-2 type transport system permease protein [Salinibacillus kushneri]|uniref:ABC-2 type transport system permease protein n=1 Tax=Salinibacillus kushneri TaxID=237682 RepID=A0A1I0AWR1_9BACI|nr:ABC transporter permease [Salinibacillus kushneri]SES98441.1 ABC-2 type transport system permease protein [Salinibacillus kushneri]